MGNVLGEGFILGGVYVIGRKQQVKSSSSRPLNKLFVCCNVNWLQQQGILLEHRETEFGDKVKLDDVLAAVRRIQQQELLPQN